MNAKLFLSTLSQKMVFLELIKAILDALIYLSLSYPYFHPILIYR